MGKTHNVITAYVCILIAGILLAMILYRQTTPSLVHVAIQILVVPAYVISSVILLILMHRHKPKHQDNSTDRSGS